MKLSLPLAATLLFAFTAVCHASPEGDAILQAENKIWDSIKDKSYTALEKALASDFRGVYAEGINTRDAELAGVKKLDLKSFTISDSNVTMIDKDAALLTYVVDVTGSDSGKDMSGKMRAASVWKKDGNDWRAVFHTDVKAE